MSTNLFLLLTFTLLIPSTTSTSSSYTDFIYAGCSQTHYTLNTPYQYNVDSLLTSLANSAHFSSYSNFTSSTASSSSSDTVSGLYQCRSDLSVPNCDNCIHSALSQLSSLCPLSSGAGIQLRGCFLRYDHDSFIGKPDTTLLYKKCGAPVQPNAGDGASSVIGMRDAALASLGTGGNYRVGAAGYVQGIAQCVGDQSAKECSDCVSSAVAQVKSLCGFAVGGDVYLGKCYVMYWSNGGYGGYSSYSSSTSTTSGAQPDRVQEAGRTVAIIIGLLVALALLIVFLSFIRRKAGKSGK